MKQKTILSREQNEEKVKIMHLKFVYNMSATIYAKRQLFRLCETDCANLFISANRFYLDDVYTRTLFYDTNEKLLAADILSHKYCMNKDRLQYTRDTDRTISYHLEDVGNELNVQFKLMVESLNLDRNGYHCVKSVQIRSFFWSVFSCIRTRKKLRIWTLFT